MQTSDIILPHFWFRGLNLSPLDVIADLTRRLDRVALKTAPIGGTLGFCVRGPEGGTWSLDLNEIGLGWRKHNVPSDIMFCSARIYADAHMLPVILIDPGAALNLRPTGQLVVEGDGRVLRALGRALSSDSIDVDKKSPEANAHP